jgi:hypothetical protein
MANGERERTGLFRLFDTPTMRRRLANLRSLQQARKRAPTPEEELQVSQQLFEFQEQTAGGGLRGRERQLAAQAGLRQTREDIIQTETEQAPIRASREAALERRRRRLRTGRRLPSLFSEQTQQTGPGGPLLV